MTQHGSFYCNELMTRGSTAAASFSEELSVCQIDIIPMPDGDYRVMMLGDRPAGAIMGMAPGTREGWSSYMAVDDVDASCAKVVDLGDKVHRQPFEVPGVRRIASVADPIGAAPSIMTPAAG